MIDTFELSDFEINLTIILRQRRFEIKKEGNRMPPVNSFDDSLPLADSTESILRFKNR